MTLPRFFSARLAKLPLSRRQCCLCGRRILRFLPYRGGWRDAPPLMSVLEVAGSDLDHHACPACGCHDRERHLLLYLRELGLLKEFSGKAILHFAPEKHLVPILVDQRLARYVRADLFPQDPDTDRVDICDMPFPDGSFDVVIANHVLEHVADDLEAVREIRRVLKPGGRALLQTPFSRVLKNTIQDEGIVTPSARLAFYGQEDHVRLYGSEIAARFTSCGLNSLVVEHNTVLGAFDPDIYGINPSEPLLLFQRPYS